MGEFFSLERMVEYFPKILAKFYVTLTIVIVATVIGLMLGLLLALVRINKIIILNELVKLYVSFVRGTPIIVQMFIVYYGLPILLEQTMNIDINRWDKLIFILITYGLNEAGFLSEMIRGAILSVPAAQSEAGYSVGLTKAQTFRRIVLPQALRVAVPVLGTNLIGLFQNTSLAYLVGIIDVMGEVHAIGTNTYHYIEGYFCATIIFVTVSIILERVFINLDRQLNYSNRRQGYQNEY